MSSNGVSMTETKAVPETKLEAARKRAAERAEKARLDAEAQELKVLETEEECIAKYGKRGVDWEMVDTDVGIFVLTPPEFVVVKAFSAIKNPTEEDAIRYVMPCIKAPSPDAMTVRGIFMNHVGVMWRCALAVTALSEVGGANKRGKY